ncbi:MAG: hypothetical protein K9J37_12305 [Saprospiraceae bacterium]|nr:hypothetical protein [Saprospiraceae bacterium]MCF8250692.1 hypothetical protein [Saprospiraceae bacterium]MCF8282734.1 hypothetical protein [Bacteroidales bacterium]MCF8312544.1 hypothetical protein [Saprospiraceae bacterium]MCF8440776.1 hypothetical protein [Saprospiraceae bacterium]
MKKLLLLGILLFFLKNSTLACDCLRTESFCETITNYGSNGTNGYWVVHAVLTKKTNDQLKFKIKETLSGDYANGKSFLFNKGDVFDFEGFIEDEEYIFHLIQPLSEPQFYNYWCGTEYLKIENGKVVGFIQQGIYEMPLNKFMELSNCGVTKPFLELKPTLITNNTFILSPNNWPPASTIELAIVNSLGQIIHAQRMEDISGIQSVTIELEGVSSGVYYCRLAYLGRRQIVKLVIVN